MSIQNELAAMLAPLDLPGDWTPRQVADYETRRQLLTNRARIIRDATSELAKLQSQIAALTDWNTKLEEWRQTLCDELLALPPRLYADKDVGTLQNLKLSITMIDRGLPSGTGYALETLRLGALMRASGYVQVGADVATNAVGALPWAGSLKEMEHFLKDLTTRQAVAQVQLDEALLDDASREHLTTERASLMAARNAAPTRKTRGDGSQYDKYPDGRCVEVS
ncbi:MAG: hypothetical protein ABI665_13990 [Vicinamibacterales bacterium]